MTKRNEMNSSYSHYHQTSNQELGQTTNIPQVSAGLFNKNDSDSDSSASSSSICTVNSNAVCDNLNALHPKESTSCKPQQSYHYTPTKQDNYKSQKSYYKSTKPVELSRNSEENLTSSMKTLYESLLPTSEDSQRRAALIEKLQKILEQEWPGKYIKVHMFGSSANSLSTLTSDVDICIVTDFEELRNVYTLATCMRKNGMQKVYCIAGAKVPIVRMWDPELKLACDMNVNNPIALRNTELVKAYVALDPRVRPLIMIIKHWTKRRVLNDAGVGGTLSTYTWVNIIINFLQMRSPPVLPILHQMPTNVPSESCIIDGVDTTFNEDVTSLKDYGSMNKETLGGLLFNFFRLFAYEFNYDHHVISVRNGCYLSKAEKGWHFGRHFRAFCIEEPFNPDRNLGNSADECSIEGIREEFKRASDVLFEKKDLNFMCQQYTFPSKKHHFDHAKVKNDLAKTHNNSGKWPWTYSKDPKTPGSHSKTLAPTQSEPHGNEKHSADKAKPSLTKSTNSSCGQLNPTQNSKTSTKQTSSQEIEENQTSAVDTLPRPNPRKFGRNDKPFKPHSMIKPRPDLPAIGAAH